MKKDLMSDAKVAVSVFMDMRRARAEGKEVRPEMVRCYPRINMGPSFYDTLEGCMFANRGMAMRDAVGGVFKGLSYEDKRVLCFSPEDGRFLVRIQLWERELEPVLPSRQYYKAMGAILHKYVEIKLRRMF